MKIPRTTHLTASMKLNFIFSYLPSVAINIFARVYFVVVMTIAYSIRLNAVPTMTMKKKSHIRSDYQIDKIQKRFFHSKWNYRLHNKVNDIRSRHCELYENMIDVFASVDQVFAIDNWHASNTHWMKSIGFSFQAAYIHCECGEEKNPDPTDQIKIVTLMCLAFMWFCVGHSVATRLPIYSMLCCKIVKSVCPAWAAVCPKTKKIN